MKMKMKIMKTMKTKTKMKMTMAMMMKKSMRNVKRAMNAWVARFKLLWQIAQALQSRSPRQ